MQKKHSDCQGGDTRRQYWQSHMHIMTSEIRGGTFLQLFERNKKRRFDSCFSECKFSPIIRALVEKPRWHLFICMRSTRGNNVPLCAGIWSALHGDKCQVWTECGAGLHRRGQVSHTITRLTVASVPGLEFMVDSDLLCYITLNLDPSGQLAM